MSKPYEPKLWRIDTSEDKSDDGEIDVVFVHGLMGSAWSTWTAGEGDSEFTWPIKLDDDLRLNVCPARVWVLDYNAPIRQKGPPKGLRQFFGWLSPALEEKIRGEQSDITLSLKQRAEYLCRGLLDGENRLGDRPIVFIAHSFGGLMVKAMLEREWVTRGDESRILRQTRAVTFLGTPHSGSALADVATTLSISLEEGAATLASALATALGGALVLGASRSVGESLARWVVGPSATVKSLSPDNPELYDLTQSYRRLAAEWSIETLSIYETRNYKVAIVVNRSSADPGVGEVLPAEGTDHATICKPSSTSSPVYHMVRQVILRAAAAAQRTTKRPVFDDIAHDILDTLRKGRFQELPAFLWEPREGRIDTGSKVREIADIKRDHDGSGNVAPNFRRRVAVEFFRICEEKLKAGKLHVSNADAMAAELSQFDVDKLILIALRKQMLANAIANARKLIVEQCAYIRSTYEPTLTVLYRAIDSLDKALTDELTLSLASELRLVRDAIAGRSRTEEKLDGDGVTRSRIDDLASKIDLMALASIRRGFLGSGWQDVQPGADVR